MSETRTQPPHPRLETLTRNHPQGRSATGHRCGYRGSSLIRNCAPLGPYSRNVPRETPNLYPPQALRTRGSALALPGRTGLLRRTGAPALYCTRHPLSGGWRIRGVPLKLGVRVGVPRKLSGLYSAGKFTSGFLVLRTPTCNVGRAPRPTLAFEAICLYPEHIKYVLRFGSLARRQIFGLGFLRSKLEFDSYFPRGGTYQVIVRFQLMLHGWGFRA